MRHIFQPIALGPLTLRNRIVFPPMTTGYEAEGVVTARSRSFYRNVARGGAGLIILGDVSVQRSLGKEKESRSVKRITLSTGGGKPCIQPSTFGSDAGEDKTSGSCAMAAPGRTSIAARIAPERGLMGKLLVPCGHGVAKAPLARKLAVILHRMWVDATEFRFGKKAAALAA